VGPGSAGCPIVIEDSEDSGNDGDMETAPGDEISVWARQVSGGGQHSDRGSDSVRAGSHQRACCVRVDPFLYAFLDVFCEYRMFVTKRRK
jgi:hypothetical protein